MRFSSYISHISTMLLPPQKNCADEKARFLLFRSRDLSLSFTYDCLIIYNLYNHFRRASNGSSVQDECRICFKWRHRPLKAVRICDISFFRSGVALKIKSEFHIKSIKARQKISLQPYASINLFKFLSPHSIPSRLSSIPSNSMVTKPS